MTSERFPGLYPRSVKPAFPQQGFPSLMLVKAASSWHSSHVRREPWDQPSEDKCINASFIAFDDNWESSPLIELFTTILES